MLITMFEIVLVAATRRTPVVDTSVLAWEGLNTHEMASNVHIKFINMDGFVQCTLSNLGYKTPLP